MVKHYFHLTKQFILGHKKTFIALAAIILLTGILEIISFYINSTKKIDSNYEDFFSISYNSFKVNIPKNLNFAGEKVPN
jgi:hypothetical protein